MTHPLCPYNDTASIPILLLLQVTTLHVNMYIYMCVSTEQGQDASWQ